ncbi:MAG: oligoendopeptidase F [Candidatus Zixiibacteriota bacterium]|nr:MAG: oligoendopeptidase F [candidate division Zixibacteria bacterium]
MRSSRYILALMLALAAGITSVGAQQAGTQFSSRDQIDARYKFDLTAVYATEELWEADYTWVEQNLNRYGSFEGSLDESASSLLDCLKFDEAVSIKLGLLELYAMLSRDVDLRSDKYRAMWDRVISLRSRVLAASAFITPEITAINEDRLRSFLDKEPVLQIYGHLFENMIRSKAHVLPKEQEQLLAEAATVTEIPFTTYTILTGSDLQFPTIKNDKGADIKLARALFSAIMNSSDRAYRQRGFRAYFKPFIDHENTLTSLLSGTLRKNVFLANARKYHSALEADLDPQNIPVAVYDNLITSINANLEPLQRWISLKRKILGIDEVHYYDLYVTMFPAEKKQYVFEDARTIVLEALMPLGSVFVDGLERAFENRRIDAFATEGKHPGSYSTNPTYGADPYVLVSWSGQLGGIFVLAHELGHNMHAYFSATAQPYVYSQYPEFTAEVASTTAEVLLHDYMVEQAQTREQKLACLESYLNNIQLVVYYTALMAEFERDIYDIIEGGGALTTDTLGKMCSGLFRKYLGDAFEADEEISYFWATIPHFHMAGYYMYHYAIGFAAAEQIVTRIVSEGDLATEDYLSFLQTGSSEYAIDMLKKTGIDVTSPDLIEALARRMTRLLDQFEQLLAEG